MVDYSIARQKEVVFRVQQALKIKPINERERWRQDDALNELRQQFKKLIIKCAYKYSFPQFLDCSQEEVAECFWDEMFDSVRKYDATKGGSPATYFYDRFRGKVNKIKELFTRGMKVGQYNFTMHNLVNNKGKEFFEKNGFSPDDEELLGLCDGNYYRHLVGAMPLPIREGYFKAVSDVKILECSALDSFMDDEELFLDRDEHLHGKKRRELSVEEKVRNETPGVTENPLEILINGEDGDIARRAFGRLSEREQFILACRVGAYKLIPDSYGIDEEGFESLIGTHRGLIGRGWTLDNVGVALGLSRERIRQIQDNEIIPKLRDYFFEEERGGEEYCRNVRLQNLILSSQLQGFDPLVAREIRKELGLSIEELSRKIDISIQSISQYEEKGMQRSTDNWCYQIGGIHRSTDRHLSYLEFLKTKGSYNPFGI